MASRLGRKRKLAALAGVAVLLLSCVALAVSLPSMSSWLFQKELGRGGLVAVAGTAESAAVTGAVRSVLATPGLEAGPVLRTSSPVLESAEEYAGVSGAMPRMYAVRYGSPVVGLNGVSLVLASRAASGTAGDARTVVTQGSSYTVMDGSYGPMKSLSDRSGEAIAAAVGTRYPGLPVLFLAESGDGFRVILLDAPAGGSSPAAMTASWTGTPAAGYRFEAERRTSAATLPGLVKSLSDAGSGK